MGNQCSRSAVPVAFIVLSHAGAGQIAVDIQSLNKRLEEKHLAAKYRMPDEEWVRQEEAVAMFLKQHGKKRPCEMMTFDARNLPANRPNAEGVLIKHLLSDTWLEPSFWSKRNLIDRYGDELVAVTDARYDDWGETYKTRYFMSVRDYIKEGRSLSITSPLSNLSRVATAYDTSLQQAVFGVPDRKVPDMFKNFENRPVVQLSAARGTGTQLHKHSETWLALLKGRKAWWIARTPTSQAISKESKFNTAHPCTWLNGGAPEGLSFCVQMPGEVMIVQKDREHAVCNLDEFVFALGAQGLFPNGMSAAQRAVHQGIVADLKKTEVPHTSQKNLNYVTARCVAKGQTEMVKYLIQMRADPLAQVNLSSSGYKGEQETNYMLHYASGRGHYHVAKLLVSLRADPDAIGWRGIRPLHWASAHGPPSFVEYFIGLRADISAIASPGLGGISGTPLHAAAEFGFSPIAEALLQHRADPSAHDGAGAAPAHRAAAGGHLAVLQLLLGHRADLSSRDDEGHTPLHFASKGRHKSAAAYLTQMAAEQRAPSEL